MNKVWILNTKYIYLMMMMAPQTYGWFVNARKKLKEKCITVRDCNLEHTCEFLNEDHYRKCNAKFVADYLLSTMGAGSSVDKAEDIMTKIIRPKLNIDIPYWVANDARPIYMEILRGLTAKFHH